MISRNSQRSRFAQAALTVVSLALVGTTVFAGSAGAAMPSIVRGCITPEDDSNISSPPGQVQTTGAATGAPLLSAVLSTVDGAGVLNSAFYLLTASGAAVGGSPTATAVVDSGELAAFQVPAGTLTSGQVYQWYVSATGPSGCPLSSPIQSFTAGTGAPTAPATGSNTAVISGGAVSETSAITDATACSGSACAATAASTLTAGFDGTDHRAGALGFTLSAIPAGAEIASATLGLTPAASDGSATDGLTVDAPLASLAGATGTAYTDGADDANTTVAATATTGIDVTSVVAGWQSGADPNDGLLLTDAAGASATSLLGYTNPVLTVTYTPAATATAPQTLMVTAGDGALIATWQPPNDSGFSDPAGANPLSYTVKAIAPGGTVTASATTQDDSQVLTGLTDGTTYTVQVTATNPQGTGPAATATGTTAAVPGSGTSYVNAVDQLLNGQDQLLMGASTTTAALSAARTVAGTPDESALVSSWLGSSQVEYQNLQSAMAASDQADTADTTTLSNVVVQLGSNGTSVNVFATATENFTTVDSSGGTSADIPGSETDNDEFTFATGSTPMVENFTDADAVVAPVADDVSAVDAFSAALSPNPVPVTGGPTQVALTAADQPVAGTSTPAVVSPDTLVGNASGAAAWAKANLKKTYNGYGDDCTDFSSRAIYYGGHLPMIIPKGGATSTTRSNDNYWWGVIGGLGAVLGTNQHVSSYSWGGAGNLLDFLGRQGSWFKPYLSQAQPGNILFVSWNGNNAVNHAGVVVLNRGNNVYVDQHSPTQSSEPVLRAGGAGAWQSKDPKLELWLVQAQVR